MALHGRVDTMLAILIVFTNSSYIHMGTCTGRTYWYGAKVQITLLCQTICNNACNEIATNIMLTSQM